MDLPIQLFEQTLGFCSWVIAVVCSNLFPLSLNFYYIFVVVDYAILQCFFTQWADRDKNMRWFCWYQWLLPHLIFSSFLQTLHQTFPALFTLSSYCSFCSFCVWSLSWDWAPFFHFPNADNLFQDLKLCQICQFLVGGYLFYHF